MPRSSGPYPTAFRQQMADLVRSGRNLRSAGQRVRAHRPSNPQLGQGRREDGLRTEELAELCRLRRENKQLRMDREILAKAVAWFARETETPPGSTRS